MWRLLIIIFFSPTTVIAQIITTIAGGGTGGEGSPATAASIFNPNGICFDNSGNMYFTEELGNKIRKINSLGIISKIAGTGSAGYSGDNGLAVNAKLNQPSGVALDSFGNLFVGDIANHAVRKINISTGVITTVCGNGTSGFSGDGGAASAAILNSPSDVKFDASGNMYIACLGSIRKINTSGVITTVAGLGNTYGNTGDGGLAINAKIQPCRIYVDILHNIYMTDNQHYVIRKVNAKTGIINRIAGANDSIGIFNGDGIPATNAHFDPQGLSLDNRGNIFIADAINNRVRIIDINGIINTITGNGMSGSIGDGSIATAAQVNRPVDLVFDKCYNLFISQINQPRIRKVTFNPPPCDYLSVDDQTFETRIAVFPNPANDEAHIENATANTTYALSNVWGAVVETGRLKNGSNVIAVHQLPPGLYMLLLTDEEGKRMVHKVVRE